MWEHNKNKTIIKIISKLDRYEGILFYVLIAFLFLVSCKYSFVLLLYSIIICAVRLHALVMEES